MNVLFLIGLLCIKHVTAQFDNPDSPLIGACVNIQVDGADDTLGFAGKHVGFPALDGCYEVSTFQSSVDDLYYLAYHKYEEDGNRPIFVNGGDDSEVWTLGQYSEETDLDLFMIGITDEVPGIELVDNWLGVTTDDEGEHVLDSDGDFIFYAITPDELSISCVPGGCGSVSPTPTSPTPTSPTPSPPAPSPTPTVPSSGSEESPSSDSSVSSVSSDSSDSSDSDDNGNGSFVSSGTKSVPMNVLGVIVFGIVVQLW